MRLFKTILIAAAAMLGMFSCDNDDELLPTSFTEGAQHIAYNAADNYKGSHDVLLERSSALEFCEVEGVLPTDEFAARNKHTGELTYLEWGYKYAGLQGDEQGYYQRVYYNDTIMVGLGFADNWQVGEYELLLLRGSAAQTIDTFNFLLLSGIETDDSKVQGGVFSVKAAGWDVPGTGAAIDSLELINKATGEVVQKMASSCSGTGDTFEMITFDREGLLTGDYELWLARWQYGLRQKIGEFAYFNYAFVDSDPMQQDAQGRYVMKFYLKECNPDDNFTVASKSPFSSYYVDRNVPFDASCYDAATQVYTYTLVDDGWRYDPESGIEFEISLNIGGVRSKVSGTARIP